MTAQVDHPSGRASPRLVAASGVIAALSVVAYAHAIRGRFIDDDWVYLNRVQQTGWWHSVAVWKPGVVLWRPVLYLYFGALHAVFGLHPLPYHLVTEALILLEGYLAYRLARRSGLTIGAMIAASVVVLQPSMATPVAWTSAASSPLSVCFALGSVLVLDQARRRPTHYLAAALLLALGLLTREVVAVAPLLFVILRFSLPGSMAWRARLRAALVDSSCLWLVVAAYVAVRVAVGFNSAGPYQLAVTGDALNNLGKLAQFATGFVDPSRAHLSQAVAGAFWCVALGLVVWSVRSGWRQAAAGMIWAVVAVLPVVFLVNQFMGAYYIDLAVPGLGLAAGTIVEQGFRSQELRRRVRPGVLVGLVLAYLLGTGIFVSRLELDSMFAGPAKRTAQLEQRLRTKPPTIESDVLHLTDVIPADQYITADGDLYRVLLHRPRLTIVSPVPLPAP